MLYNKTYDFFSFSSLSSVNFCPMRLYTSSDALTRRISAEVPTDSSELKQRDININAMLFRIPYFEYYIMILSVWEYRI